MKSDAPLCVPVPFAPFIAVQTAYHVRLPLSVPAAGCTRPSTASAAPANLHAVQTESFMAKGRYRRRHHREAHCDVSAHGRVRVGVLVRVTGRERHDRNLFELWRRAEGRMQATTVIYIHAMLVPACAAAATGVRADHGHGLMMLHMKGMARGCPRGCGCDGLACARYDDTKAAVHGGGGTRASWHPERRAFS